MESATTQRGLVVAQKARWSRTGGLRRETRSVKTLALVLGAIFSRDFALDMVNVRRLPGVFFTHKIKVAFLAVTVVSILCCLHHWGFVCTSSEIRKEIQKLCKFYDAGEAVGNLCKPLCKEKTIESTTCTPQKSGSGLAFAAKWNNRFIVLKSSFRRGTARIEGEIAKNMVTWKESEGAGGRKTMRRRRPRGVSDDERRKAFQESDAREASEKRFEAIIRGIISDKLNVSVTKSQLESLRYLDVKKKLRDPETSDTRKTEKVVGTCGHFFAVEHLRSPQFNSFFMLDDTEEWSERMKLAIEIMDFVEELETNFPDALHLCDIRMSHFGVTNGGRLKFLDLNSVYTNNVVEKITTGGEPCRENEDCDFNDCKSVCNPRTKLCDGGIANNNLQVVCEKIFVGWTMSGKIIVPGLLMSEHTPASLATLLRLCAENGRSPVPEDVRQRLYTTLTEMYQILTQRLSM